MSEWFEEFGCATVIPELRPGEGSLTIGAYPTDEADAAVLIEYGITKIINLCQDCEYWGPQRSTIESVFARSGMEEFRIQIEDYSALDHQHFDQAVERVAQWLQSGEHVYLHCRAGWQRSASVAAAVIAQVEKIDIDQALAELKKRKPSAAPLEHQEAALRAWFSTSPGN